jgi:hypothetical protein
MGTRQDCTSNVCIAFSMENHVKRLRILRKEGSYRYGVQKLRHKIRVPLPDSYDEGKFEHEDPKTPAWSPPYEDSQDLSDAVMEDDGDIRHWPPEENSQLKYEELKDFACEDNMEQEEMTEDIRVRKAEMNLTKDPLSVVRSSISRFSITIYWVNPPCQIRNIYP